MTRSILVLMVLLFTSSHAQARENLLDIQEVTSPGGIKAWLVEDHAVPVIALKFGFKGAGAALDPAEKQGLSRLLSNTMDEGAGELTSQEFQKELQDLVITLSFGSNRDDFLGNLKTLTKNKDRAFELMEMALTAPRFDEDAVGRMREANQSRIRSSLANPEWLAARLINDKAFSEHPYAQNSGGTLSSLARITPEDLRNFQRTNLGKNNLYVSVAGDITAEELGSVLDQLFGQLPEVEMDPIPDIEVQNQGKTFIYNTDIPQTIIERRHPGLDLKDPDFQIAKVMNFILGSSGFSSRLTEEAREKRGLTYGIYSYFQNMDNANALVVSTSTKNETTAEMLTIIENEWDKMLIKMVTNKELESAKSYLIGSLPLSLTSTDKIAGLLLTLQIDNLPIDYLAQREEKILAVTKKDILIVATYFLDSEHFTTVLVGQPEGIEDAEIIESLPNVE